MFFFGSGEFLAQIAQVYGIKRLLPEKLQIVLVSATLPDEAVLTLGYAGECRENSED